jgi:hypothetical protein
MKADEVKRLKELERENARLKAIVADQALENRALKEVANQHDMTADGRALRLVNVVDEFTREALVMRVERSITADGDRVRAGDPGRPARPRAQVPTLRQRPRACLARPARLVSLQPR